MRQLWFWSSLILVLMAAPSWAEDKYYCAFVSRRHPAKTETVAVYFKTPDDLASTLKSEDTSVHVVADQSQSSLASSVEPFAPPSPVRRLFTINKDVYDRAKEAPGVIPGATHLLALHNLEPWLRAPGNAPDLIRERFEAAWPQIIQQADE